MRLYEKFSVSFSYNHHDFLLQEEIGDFFFVLFSILICPHFAVGGGRKKERAKKGGVMNWESAPKYLIVL